MKNILLVCFIVIFGTCQGQISDYVRFSKEFCQELSNQRYLGILAVVRSDELMNKSFYEHYIIEVRQLYFEYLRYHELNNRDFAEFLYRILNNGYTRNICDGNKCFESIDYLCKDPIPLKETSLLEFAIENQLERNKEYDYIYESKSTLNKQELLCLVKTMFFNEFLILYSDEHSKYKFIKFEK